MNAESFQFSNSRFTVDYHFRGSEPEALAMAEALCFDQTVELPDALVEPGPIRDHVIGRVEHIQPVGDNTISATVSFACDLVGEDLTQLLNVIFGIASLKSGIRVTHLHLPDSFI